MCGYHSIDLYKDILFAIVTGTVGVFLELLIKVDDNFKCRRDSDFFSLMASISNSYYDLGEDQSAKLHIYFSQRTCRPVNFLLR